MPASMIRAGAGSSPKVNGKSMATVATGPIPGSTPTRVPRKQPMKQEKMFCQASATPSPKARLDSDSIGEELGQSGSGRASSQTKTATEKTISAAASASVSSGRTSRAACAPTSTSTAMAATRPSHCSAIPNRTIATSETASGRAWKRGTAGPSSAKARSAITAPSAASNAPTSVGNIAGPMRCMSPRRYCCASRTKPPPIATKIRPAQKSLGERMCIGQPRLSCPRKRASSIDQTIRGYEAVPHGCFVFTGSPAGACHRAGLRPDPLAGDDTTVEASIRPDVRLLHDDLEALEFLHHALVQLRRARGDGFHAAPGEALPHVGHVEDLHHLGVELVDDRLRRALGREQRGPVGGVHLLHAGLLQGQPFRIER